jgi:hypothetical protein
LNGRMAATIPSKSATLIRTASSVAVIAECREPIKDNLHTRPNVPTVAMCMEQMGQTCTRESALNVKKEHLGSGIGRLSRSEI